MGSFVLPQLEKLQDLRETPAIVYSSMISDDTVRILYECLRRMQPTPRLDLVLFTTGGTVTTARRLALLLREFTQYLTILVPHRARSAGTLLCLSANELILGPMAELGPIDVHISSAGPPPPDAPGMISAEDVQAFRHMAGDWFGVNSEEDRLQVLALVAQRVFPLSLSSFYRSAKLTSQAAYELLQYQLPDVEDDFRKQIVNQLISGYGSHDHVITRTEAKTLGLRVHFTSSQEETLLWELSRMKERQFLNQFRNLNEEGTIGLIMSTSFCARQVQCWVDSPQTQRGEVQRKEEGGLFPQKIPQISWEIDEE